MALVATSWPKRSNPIWKSTKFEYVFCYTVNGMVAMTTLLIVEWAGVTNTCYHKSCMQMASYTVLVLAEICNGTNGLGHKKKTIPVIALLPCQFLV